MMNDAGGETALGVLKERLEPLGITVRETHVEEGASPTSVLAASDLLGYLVVGRVIVAERRTASASVHSKAIDDPQTFSQTGSDACGRLGTSIAQHFLSPAMVGAYINSRRHDAEQRLRSDEGHFESLRLAPAHPRIVPLNSARAA